MEFGLKPLKADEESADGFWQPPPELPICCIKLLETVEAVVSCESFGAFIPEVEIRPVSNL